MVALGILGGTLGVIGFLLGGGVLELARRSDKERFFVDIPPKIELRLSSFVQREVNVSSNT